MVLSAPFDVIKNRLSPLESDVLDVLIKENQANAKAIYGKLRKRRKIAVTSVCVMLDRLYEKGLVTRTTENCKGGFRYIYYAKKSEKDYEIALIDNTVKQLMKKFGGTAIAYFNEKFGKK